VSLIPRRPAVRGDGGFTLIEVIVVMALVGILSATAVWGLRAYQRSQDEQTTATQMVATLRNLAERAQSEGRTYCLSFDSTKTWSEWRYSCQSGWTSGSDTATRVSTGDHVQGANTSLTGISFAAGVSAGTCATTCIYFYPRGTASAGSLTVRRSGSAKTYLVKVEGLTGRVYLG
jgi:type II secretion system protein H